jgi:hypothetical protein
MAVPSTIDEAAECRPICIRNGLYRFLLWFPFIFLKVGWDILLEE